MKISTPRHPTRYIVAPAEGDASRPFVVLRPAELGGHSIHTTHATESMARRQAAHTNAIAKR